MNAPLSAAALQDANQHALVRHIALLRDRLRQAAPGQGEAWPDPRHTVPALGRVAGLFGLSRFEAETLLLAAAPELDGTLAGLCAVAQGDAARCWPSFGLALALLPEPHWSALLPAAPLRHWLLVEVDTEAGLAGGRLRASEAVLHHLAGLGGLDERLAGWLLPVPPASALPERHERAAAQVGSLWRKAMERREPPRPVRLSGPDAPMLRDAASSICARAHLSLLGCAFGDLPTQAEKLAPMLRLIERDCRLAGAALLVQGDGPGIGRLLDTLDIPVILVVSAPSVCRGDPGERRPHEVALALPEGLEARRLWQDALPLDLPAIAIEGVLGQFRLSPSAIRNVAETVAAAPVAARPDVLWAGCREAAGQPAASLAERILPCAGWDDLVLPAAQLRLLRLLTAQLRGRAKVLGEWGFAARGTRGLGTAALFAGPSGTGKTMAAEVIAGELALDLFRIDLSQVVSKWIGETEKNLAQLFDSADAGGAVLLFDEADALFGRRSEVTDSHDRYANIEVSFLLQRLESFRGLAILATNTEAAVDGAFLRRLRCIVRFPQPDAAQRAAIWRTILPLQTPRADIRPDKLARLAVSGGTIRNIALTAAYLAADAGQDLGMEDLRQAAEIECAKLNRPLSPAETAGWA